MTNQEIYDLAIWRQNFDHKMNKMNKKMTKWGKDFNKKMTNWGKNFSYKMNHMFDHQNEEDED